MAPCSRTHLVLVPGFAGFDALGQLEYYAGITPLFRRWQAEAAPDSRLVLHYFDNLPTAGVATRARRLRAFLGKRAARGELCPQGHPGAALAGGVRLRGRGAGRPLRLSGAAVPSGPDPRGR